MKTTLRSRCLALLLAVSPFLLQPASAGWFGGEKARLLDKAESEFEAAKTAGKNYQVVVQMTELTKALGTYRQLQAQYPDYETEKVSARIREASFTLGSIKEKARRGEISLPADELSGTAQGVAAGSSEAVDFKKPSEPEPRAFRRPIPELVKTETGPAAAEPEDAPDAPDSSWMRESLPNPLRVRGGEPPPAPAAPAAAENARPGREDPARLARFAGMIRENKAAQAVLALEDLVEEEGDSASVGTRVMFVRALLACENYGRAAAEAAAIPESAASDPAVRSVRAAVAVARGDLMEAQRQLDLLVTERPDYSDAYVDFAYVTFLADPANAEFRDMAVTYYKTALMRGARRDARLEEELGIRVE